MSSILGLGASPGEGHGNPHQYSCLKNPIDRGAWWATVHGVTKIPWKRAWQTTSAFLPEESHRQRSLVGYSP